MILLYRIYESYFNFKTGPETFWYLPYMVNLISTITRLRCRLPTRTSFPIRLNSTSTSTNLNDDIYQIKTKTKHSIHPTAPARTRFAPSPTGYLHLGSLRTALYNYLLAKNTGGSFILRIEDTDRSRLNSDAEKNIFDTLKWCNLSIDESSNDGGKYGPYRQSERKEIYAEYADILLKKGLAYKCFCSKERLIELRESARLLKPPTNVTYDRKCLSTNESTEDRPYVIRFKSPHHYPKFNDLLHGELNLQPQYNSKDQRFDDFIIIKNDGMPTYHFANIIDDHLMKITHVIRGEEWLPSTPKHIALYKAFDWEPPQYIHIPLLTSLEDKKLSKRKGDFNILELQKQEILPQALINFVALFGWAPSRELNEKFSEVMTLESLVQNFSLNHLTKGNVKVNQSKLHFFQKEHFSKIVQTGGEEFDKLIDDYLPGFLKYSNGKDKSYLIKITKLLAPNISKISDIKQHEYLFKDVKNTILKPPRDVVLSKKIIDQVLESAKLAPLNQVIEEELGSGIFKKKDIFMTLRASLSNGQSGLPIPSIIELLGDEECINRLQSYRDNILK
ncbi:MSE1 [Candida pseudojiufengensis]|uniref:MSE1 n=1 Tax=Candida pseudojiufengensis TaxID=497109 RepID=UPI002224BFD1|nr:MSE1 [Candida pseudojiufengensis]KAI5963677.1 MSE1 [Candida pseudojiufengensis]